MLPSSCGMPHHSTSGSRTVAQAGRSMRAVHCSILNMYRSSPVLDEADGRIHLLPQPVDAQQRLVPLLLLSRQLLQPAEDHQSARLGRQGLTSGPTLVGRSWR